jgi:predicted nucleic acid-binding protein
VSYLLDTNVLSELRKGPRGHPHVATWFASVPDHAIYLSVLVLGEIRRGIERLRSRDPRSAMTLEDWLMQVITRHRGRITRPHAAPRSHAVRGIPVLHPFREILKPPFRQMLLTYAIAPLHRAWHRPTMF